MDGRPRIGISLIALTLALVALVAVAAVAAYLALVPSDQSTITRSQSSLSLAVGLSPASPLIAPGQVQNYSSIQLSTVGGSGLSGTLALRTFAPAGISLALGESSVSLANNPQSIPLELKADSGIVPGSYQVIIETSSSSAQALNTTLTVDVVPALVTIQGAAFHEQNITVAKGTEVTWINLDSTLGCCDPGVHDVSFLSGVNATSPHLARFETWSYTFGSDGVAEYFCTIDPYMKGQVTVTG